MSDGSFLRYVGAGPRMPTVRDVDGRLEVDWPHPRPATFEISAEALEVLIERANHPCAHIATSDEGTSYCTLAERTAAEAP